MTCRQMENGMELNEKYPKHQNLFFFVFYLAPIQRSFCHQLKILTNEGKNLGQNVGFETQTKLLFLYAKCAI